MIEATALTKRYGGTVAVDDLSFAVRPGHVTGFLGPNGAGKSTTMRMILGLDAPTRGSVTVDGHRFADLVWPLHKVGALLDANAVHGGRTAHAHLSALARSNGIAPQRVRGVLEDVGLSSVAHKRVRGFSLGMKQRLGIAAALLGDPGILMFDEPVNGLDPEGIRWIREVFRRLAAEGRTVLVSSHLMSEMALTADHLLIIGRGRLIADTSVTEFVAAAGTTRLVVRSSSSGELARLLLANGADVEPGPDAQIVVTGVSAELVGDMAAGHSIPIYDLRTEHASLEEAFMTLTADRVEFRAPAHTPTTSED
jgi:ABC-2 type transport system ATP-binding protein